MNTLRLTTLALGLMVSGVAAAQTYVVDRYRVELYLSMVSGRYVTSKHSIYPSTCWCERSR